MLNCDGRRSVKIIISILLLALAVRLLNLGLRPMISKDGVYYVQLIEQMEKRGPATFYPQPLFHVSAWGLHRFTGLAPQTAGHALSLFFGLSCLILLYAMAWKAGGVQPANITGIVYALHPLTVINDADVSNISLGTFLTLLCLGAMWHGLKNGSVWSSLATPPLLVLALMSRRETLALVPIMILAPCVMLAWSAHSCRRHMTERALRFLLLSLMSSALMVLIVYWGLAIVRVRMEELVEKVVGSLLVATRNGTINIAGVRDVFGDGTKAVFYSIAPFAMIGIVCGFRSVADRTIFYLLILFLSFFFTLLLLRGATFGPVAVSSRYFLIGMPVVLLFAGIGLSQAILWAQRRKRWISGLAVAAMLVPCCYKCCLENPYKDERPLLTTAEFICKEYGTGRVVASERSQIAYYARGKHIQLPLTSPGGEGIEFLVLRGRGQEPEPKLWMANGAVEKIKIFDNQVWLYRVTSQSK